RAHQVVDRRGEAHRGVLVAPPHPDAVLARVPEAHALLPLVVRAMQREGPPRRREAVARLAVERLDVERAARLERREPARDGGLVGGTGVVADLELPAVFPAAQRQRRALALELDALHGVARGRDEPRLAQPRRIDRERRERALSRAGDRPVVARDHVALLGVLAARRADAQARRPRAVAAL